MYHLLQKAFLLSLASAALGQNSGSTTSASTLHSVDVGENGLTFTPDTITAAVGDKVQFSFYPKNHSVIQSTFAQPCTFQPNGFASGFVPVSSGESDTKFTITITDTQPIWLFCAQTKHCQEGMAMVINTPANSNKTLGAYKLAAARTTVSTSPAGVEGGVLSNSSSSSTSSSATSGSASSSSASGSSPSGASSASSASNASGPSSTSSSGSDSYGTSGSSSTGLSGAATPTATSTGTNATITVTSDSWTGISTSSIVMAMSMALMGIYVLALL